MALTFTWCISREQETTMVLRTSSASLPVVLVEPFADVRISPVTQTVAPWRASLAVEARPP
jgi:hypothetical protein